MVLTGVTKVKTILVKMIAMQSLKKWEFTNKFLVIPLSPKKL